MMVTFTWMYTYLQTHQDVYVKYIQLFPLHRSHLNFRKVHIVLSPGAELPHVGPQKCHGPATPVRGSNSRYKGLKRQEEDQDSAFCACVSKAPFCVGPLWVFF